MSKRQILTAIRNHKPTGQAPLPLIPAFPEKRVDAVETFMAVSEAGGSRVIRIAGLESLQAALNARFPDAGAVASPLPAAAGTVPLDPVESPAALEQVEVAVIRGRVGVAENGAIWVTESDCIHRVLPFICQHLAIVLEAAAIVPDMHAAYARIQVDEEAFGLFIAGPSKTADIEQALVIGAQAARSLTIFLTDKALS